MPTKHKRKTQARRGQKEKCHYVTGVPEGEENKKEIFEETTAENFPELKKNQRPGFAVYQI